VRQVNQHLVSTHVITPADALYITAIAGMCLQELQVVASKYLIKQSLQQAGASPRAYMHYSYTPTPCLEPSELILLSGSTGASGALRRQQRHPHLVA
jgi:hypothetical protein